MRTAILGQPYSDTLVASGGSTPYHWSLTAGTLPTGLSLNTKTGVITGTPRATGRFSPTVAVQDSANHDAIKTLQATVVPKSSGGTSTSSSSSKLGIEPPTNLNATVGRAYSATLKVSGGRGPYHWTVSDGTLPSGLQLNSTSGAISGTPTRAGAVAFTASVTDSTRAATSQALAITVSDGERDAYGGLATLPCPSPNSAQKGHFYTAQIGSRWHLCTPAGNAFWMNGVYDAAPNDSANTYQGVSLAKIVAVKYATGLTGNSTLNWALQTVRRLESWGFNTIAEYGLAWTLPVSVNSNWPTFDQTIPTKLPFTALVSPSLYALTNAGHYANGPVKDILNGVKTSVYNGYRSHVLDFWDPNWKLWLQNALNQDPAFQRAIHGPNHQYLIGFNVDDTDNLEGFGAGPDFPTVANGVISPGKTHPQLAWLILVSSPTQTSNTKLKQTYSDKTNFSKMELSQWLAQRYQNNIAALNQAWGSRYTSFGSSLANGGWGVGSGLLDEDGLCPASHGVSCWVPKDPYQLEGATTAMKNDLSAFLLFDAEHYFAMVKTVLAAKAPGVLYLGPTTLGTWGTPPRREVLEAAAKSVDLLMLPSLPPDCADCGDGQQRLDFVARYGGNKPWIDWEGYQANADSFMSPYAIAGDEFKTQAARGAMYAKRLSLMLAAEDSSAIKHFVGLKWWALYDSRAERANWGLLTLRDDPYDGRADVTTAGVDTWGYPTGCISGLGCERARYGDFLTSVTHANDSAMRLLAAGQ